MANAFVQYFNNVGSILNEKCAWYRILTVLIISCLYEYGVNSFQKSMLGVMNNTQTSFNVPLIILAILCCILVSGFSLQVMSDKMNNGETLIPKLDFMQMFVNGLKAIPFHLVWILYIVALGIVLALIAGLFALLHLGFISAILYPVACIALIFVFMPTFCAVMALFAKDFKYTRVLNPAILFKLMPDTIGGVYLAILASLLMTLGLIISVGLVAYLIYKAVASVQPELSFIIGVLFTVVILYIAQVMGYAFSCTVVDVTREALDIIDGPSDFSGSNGIGDIKRDNYMHNTEE